MKAITILVARVLPGTVTDRAMLIAPLRQSSVDVVLIGVYAAARSNRGLDQRFGLSGDHALAQLPDHALCVAFVQSQLVRDLAVGDVQPHQVQTADPHPQRLMMAAAAAPANTVPVRSSKCRPQRLQRYF